MTEQALSAWVALLRGHAGLIRALNAQLLAEHGLTLNDYEVLLHLAQAPDHQLRRVDLAERIVLTASGITRLLDGLERQGWVKRGECCSDRRVTYAVLTEAGEAKLREAAGSHLEDVRLHFAGLYSDEELETLAELLGRLSGDGGSCSP